jgi:hypothetical protein
MHKVIIGGTMNVVCQLKSLRTSDLDKRRLQTVQLHSATRLYWSVRASRSDEFISSAGWQTLGLQGEHASPVEIKHCKETRCALTLTLYIHALYISTKLISFKFQTSLVVFQEFIRHIFRCKFTLF